MATVTITELREILKRHLETESLVYGGGDIMDCLYSAAESSRVDDLSDEEVVRKAKEIGIIN